MLGMRSRLCKSRPSLLGQSNNAILSVSRAAWTWLNEAKAQMGNRVLVVTAQDKISQEFANRALFELQKIRKQVIFCTIPTKFPVPKGIEEGVNLYLRSGCTSILSIGSSTISDASKAMRHLLVQKKNKSALFDMLPIPDPEKPKMDVPLVCVPRSISPLHYTNSFAILMNDEDAFFHRQAALPQLIVKDSQFLPKTPNSIGKGSILSAAFDCFYAKQLAIANSFTIDATLNGSILNEAISSDCSNKLFDCAEVIGQFRNQICDDFANPVNQDVKVKNNLVANTEHWPGLVEAATMATAVHAATVNTHLEFPYSHRSIQVLNFLFEVLKEESPEIAQSRRRTERPLKAAYLAFSELSACLGLTQENLCKLVNELTATAMADVKKLNTDIITKGGAKKAEDVSAGTIAQGFMITEESEIEKRLKLDSPTQLDKAGDSLKLATMNCELFETVIEKIIS